MGDRAQLQIVNGNHAIYLYTHWRGSSLEKILRAGLTAGRALADDPSYCLASVLREFVRATGGIDNHLGMGVGFAFEDNDDSRGAPLVLDVRRKVVRFRDAKVAVADFVTGMTIGWK